jgi:ATP-dependent DNA helicase DinG
MIGRTGRLWQSEYYDHIIRNEEELHRQIAYVHENALRSGIQNWTWCGRQDELIAELVGNISSEHGLVAHATKQANPASGKKTKPNAVTPPNPRFAFIQKRLGIDQAQTLELGSPFDYADQATLYIENDLPDPNDNLRFLPAACEKILRYLDMTHGGAFVLFTSYRMLQDAAARLKYDIEKQLGLPMLIQGQNVPRKLLLEQFRALDNAVLFGTSSFWQGIDVQGEKLRNVIIVKLPFSVPDEPLLEAKLDAIKKSGGNPFMELQVPEAIIKLKQGFGRLIRSKTDRGIVVLLDNRVRSKRYGPLFLDSLPPCRVVDVT